MVHNKVVIIGGGLGGLVTGIILQKNNYEVTIIEKNTRVGGLLQSFKRKGCRFDTGMHYVGSLDKGQVMYKIFKYLNVYDKLDFERMDAQGHDVFRIGDREYKFPFGWDNFTNQMAAYFPNEKNAIAAYVCKIKEVANSHDLYNLRTPIKFDLSETSSLEESAFDFIKSITNNKELQNVLSALNSIYAGKKDNSSLYMHAVIHNYYNNSAYKMKDGGESIARALVSEFKSLGGEVFVKEEIVKFNFEKKQISSIVSKSSKEFEADYFISNLHPSLTVKMIDDNIVRRSYKNRMLNLKNTISVFGVNVVLKKNIFPKMNYNFHRYFGDDVWGVDMYSNKNWPQEYLIYTPVVAEGEEMSKCFSVYSYMKFEEVEQWSDSIYNQRPLDYKEWKQSKSNKLLEMVEKDFPEIKNQIDAIYPLSPLSYRDYINNVEGEMYGVEHDCNNAVYSRVFPATKVKNLFLTGQNVNMHGMLGVALGSMLTANEFVPIDNIVESITNNNNV